MADVPGHQLFNTSDRVVANAFKHLVQVSVRIQAIEFMYLERIERGAIRAEGGSSRHQLFTAIAGARKGRGDPAIRLEAGSCSNRLERSA